MKKTLAMITVLLVSLVMVMGTAHAKMILGKVKKVDSTAKAVHVAKTDAVTNVEAIEVVEVPVSATLTGIAALEELSDGTEVWIDAIEDKTTGKVVASAIKVTAPKAAAAPVAPVAAPVVAAAPVAPAPVVAEAPKTEVAKKTESAPMKY